MRVLVVEDEVRMAALLKRGLEEDGYAVDVAGTGPDAVWQAGVAAVGWGTTDALEAAKGAARSGDPGAVDALQAASRKLSGT